jgi:hypothetical protein
MATIFLSHSSKNDALASQLEFWLKREGFDDLFVDHDGIRSGDKWTEALRRAKSSCRVVICLVTPEWLSSDECYGEFTAGWYAGRRMIPALSLTGSKLDSKQQIRLNRVLSEDQGADLAKAGAPDALDLIAFPDIAEPLKAGLRAAGALAKVGLDPFAFEIDRSARPEPFPGLESFGDTDADAALFFGRSPEIAQCLEDLREMRASGDRRAYAIVGPSGSGKSSLMLAGVLPRLRREQGWLALRSFRPGADPLLSFADSLARTSVELGEARASGTIRDALLGAYRRKENLRDALDAVIAPLKLRSNRPESTVLIAMDQSEELARAEGESGACLGLILKAALAPNSAGEAAQYSVMLTVRTDSFVELQGAPHFEGVVTRTADIRTLPVYRFDNAIEQPAARYGVEIEPDLIEALMEDAGGRDALPLLAFTLQRLWQQYEADRRIRKVHYVSIGKLSGLIEDAAERALRGFDPTAQQGPLTGRISDGKDKLAQRTFVPSLAQFNERGAAIRRVAQTSTFSEDSRALLEWFDKWRLVTTNGGSVEVSHESMFREWPRFRRWLEPEKAKLETLRGLESAAASWVSKDRSEDDLIHSGRRLRQARNLDKWEEFKAHIDRDADVRAYLDACTRRVSGVGMVGRYAFATALFFLVVGSGILAVGFAWDGPSALPFLAWSAFGTSVIFGTMAVGGFAAAVFLRSIGRRLRTNSDAVTVSLAVPALVAILGVDTFSLLSSGYSLEQLGEAMKAQWNSQQPWMSDRIEPVSARTAGYFSAVNLLVQIPLYFAFLWLVMQIVSLVFSPLVMLFRMVAPSLRHKRLPPNWRADSQLP